MKRRAEQILPLALSLIGGWFAYSSVKSAIGKEISIYVEQFSSVKQKSAVCPRKFLVPLSVLVPVLLFPLDFRQAGVARKTVTDLRLLVEIDQDR
jgi:hypothetical protein